MQRKPSRRRKPKATQPHRRQSEGTSRPQSRRYLVLFLAAVAVVVPLGWWAYSQSASSGTPAETPKPQSSPVAEGPSLHILCPFDGSVFPPDMASPRFFWADTTAGVDRWTIEFAFEDGASPMKLASDVREWTPAADTWEEIKRRSSETKATLTICGVNQENPEEVRSRDAVSTSTSKDEVGAPIFYREVNLPFVEAVKDPAAHICWRFGSVSSQEQPPVVLEKMPLCGNCHSFSSDGSLIGMDVDYGSDKGSYVISPVSQEMVYDDAKIITWSDYKPEDNRGTLGLLSQVSPDGHYVISTVKDRSVFAAVDNLAFSQLFFPIQGILAYYDRYEKTFHALHGADDERYVQSNATWSPDGKYVVFARSEAYNSKALETKRRGLTRTEDITEFLSGQKTFKFDLWRVPFNNGKGGEPEPLRGASNNGMSNYFPKYSPDGKWIVFCQAKSFMLLQPNSNLYIIPSEGGEARRLECNTSRMNSWHSWSPNGKWLVFSSKAYSLYTQLFLTHVDEEGHTTPPVVLARFTSAERAANIPEFVNASPDAIRHIRADFIGDLSFYKVGRWNVRDGNYDQAIRDFKHALELNPENVEARVALGNVLLVQSRFDESRRQFKDVISRDPANKDARWLLGSVFEKEGKLPEAMRAYERALKIDPEYAPALQAIGRLALKMGAIDSGRKHLLDAARLDPDNSSPYVDLANSYLRERNIDQAIIMYRRALERAPDSDTILVGLAIALLQARGPGNADEAVLLATKACQVTEDKSAPAMIVLAEACTAAGRLPEAVAAAHKALDAAQQTGDANLVRMAANMLGEYEHKMNLGGK